MNNIFKNTTLLLLLTIISSSSFGQRCLTSVKKAEALRANPNLIEQINAQEENTQRWIRENRSTINSRAVVTVPVVVHVIWRQAEENISSEQILSQIEVLNTDFRKLNDDFSSGPSAFQSLGADVEIEFCLAAISPSGDSTNGITRTETTVDNIGETENWYKTADGGHDSWDVKKYVNIWVCDIGDDGLLGFATPPGYAFPVASDGMVIGHQFFGTTGTAKNSEPYNLGRTSTHEMGHYFNLEHLWGLEEGQCIEHDFVDDTPNQDSASGGCPSFPLLDSCTNTGNGVMFNNYMDYSNDACMNLFTEGQKLRMLAALNGERADLLTGNIGCSTDTTITAINEITLFQATIFPNPVKDQLRISLPEDSPQDGSFAIYNSIGKKMREFMVEKYIELDVKDLPNGIYFLISSNPIIAPQKFIVSK